MRRPLIRLGGLGILVGLTAAALLFATGPMTLRVGDADRAADSTTLGKGNHPNVVLIIADDLRRDKVTAAYLPNVWALSQRTDSRTFTNAFVSNPLCCPSRTTILTGRYSHSTGVWSNRGPHGGFRAFRDDADTLAVDFQGQGYRTAMIGKYLNGYLVERQGYVPPGWDVWFAVNTGAYLNFPARTNDGVLRFGDRPHDYSSTVLADRAVEFVRGGDGPFFLYLAFTAPHAPSRPLARDAERFAGEEDWPISSSDRRPRTMLGAAYGMDREIGRLIALLPPDTLILFMSDNGIIWNAREGRRGKRWPYDPAVHVPMIFAGLRNALAPLHAADADLVGNVDIRVSLLHAAGLRPLSAQEGLDWFATGYAPRDHVLLEHAHGNGGFAYCGIRTPAALYVRFADGDEEYYDEISDPKEVRNLAGRDPESMAGLRRLAIAECRPTPPGFDWGVV